MTYTSVGLGELLWDMLPGGKQLGGAPANFAYMSTLLGARGVVASRVGADALGEEARGRVRTLGVDVSYLQTDTERPTGTVHVEVDAQGQPKFTIHYPVAWDNLALTPEWQKLAREADVICFGTLAQRYPTAADTIHHFLREARPEALRIFDVNLRQWFYSSDVLFDSMQVAQVTKLNHEEIPKVLETLAISPTDDDVTAAKRLLRDFSLDVVCVTRGANGSVLVTRDEVSEHPGFRVRVADTVGAGDAFTAALAHGWLRKDPLSQINEAANRLGAWVTSQLGATPSLEGKELNAVLAGVGSPAGSRR